MDYHKVVESLGQWAEANTVIGDLNYCAGTKRRRLGEFI